MCERFCNLGLGHVGPQSHAIELETLLLETLRQPVSIGLSLAVCFFIVSAPLVVSGSLSGCLLAECLVPSSFSLPVFL